MGQPRESSISRARTLSIFGTVIEHAAPAAARADDFSLLGLASISRELSANDPQVNPVSKLGMPTDLNVELLFTPPDADVWRIIGNRPT